jgi:dynein heavy chain
MLKKKYRREMDYVYAVINEMDRKLERPIRDLDDVRMVMETLKKIREQEVDMELKIDPIEVYTCRSFLRFWKFKLCLVTLLQL